MTTSMIISLRVLLVAGALVVLGAVCTRVRAKRIQMQDAIFWLVLVVALALAAIFPRVVYAISDLIGFMSPSNLVFLTMIAVLFAKTFADACEISTLKHRVNQLSEELALAGADDAEAHAARELEVHALAAHMQAAASRAAEPEPPAEPAAAPEAAEPEPAAEPESAAEPEQPAAPAQPSDKGVSSDD